MCGPRNVGNGPLNVGSYKGSPEAIHGNSNEQGDERSEGGRPIPSTSSTRWTQPGSEPRIEGQQGRIGKERIAALVRRGHDNRDDDGHRPPDDKREADGSPRPSGDHAGLRWVITQV